VKSKLDIEVIESLGKFRKYDFDSVGDLLRVIRNKTSHYRDMPKEAQEKIGAIPQEFLQYFVSRFPLLLLHTYKIIAKYCCNEKSFEQYSLIPLHN